MNTTDERDQFLEEIRHKKRVLQSEKGRLDAAKRTYKNAQDKQVIFVNRNSSTKHRNFNKKSIENLQFSCTKIFVMQ